MKLIQWFGQLIRIQYPGPPHVLGCWGASHSEVAEGTVYSFWSGTTLEAPTINWKVSLRDGSLRLVYSCCYSPLTFWKPVLLLRTKPGPDWVALSVLGPRSGWRLRCLLSFSLSCAVNKNLIWFPNKARNANSCLLWCSLHWHFPSSSLAFRAFLCWFIKRSLIL